MDEKKVAQHWDKMAEQETKSAWITNHVIRDRIMQRITGTNKFWLNWLLEDYLNKPLINVLSIGCGVGDHEIIMMKTKLIGNIDAIDISSKSIEIAKKKAEVDGIKNINFQARSASDFLKNHPTGHYDAICFFGSLHHMVEVEDVLMAAQNVLKSDGYILFNEYIGNCYGYLEKKRIDIINRLLGALSSQLRNGPSNLHTGLPTPQQIRGGDSSECVRSSLIMPFLQIVFDLELVRPYGGSILHSLYPMLNHQILDSGTAEATSIVQLLCEIEDLLIVDIGEIRNDFLVGVARQRGLLESPLEYL